MPSPRYFREVPGRYRLEASKCRSCGKVSFPVRPLCPKCRLEDAETIVLSRTGKVVTSTIINTGPDEFLNESPYAMAVVETPEGARMMVQVVDCVNDAVKPGMEVNLEFRLIRKEARGGILCYGHKAVPVGGFAATGA